MHNEILTLLYIIVYWLLVTSSTTFNRISLSDVIKWIQTIYIKIVGTKLHKGKMIP